MADFLEERLLSLIRYGSSYADDYAVNVVMTSGGSEYRSLVHPFPVRTFDVSWMLDKDTTYTSLQGVYHRAHGKYAGFRARCEDEALRKMVFGPDTSRADTPPAPAGGQVLFEHVPSDTPVYAFRWQEAGGQRTARVGG